MTAFLLSLKKGFDDPGLQCMVSVLAHRSGLLNNYRAINLRDAAAYAKGHNPQCRILARNSAVMEQVDNPALINFISCSDVLSAQHWLVNCVIRLAFCSSATMTRTCVTDWEKNNAP